MLTIAILLPILAAVGVGLARNVSAGDGERRLQLVATVVAAIPLVVLLVAWSRFAGTGGFEQVETIPWIPSLGIAWKVGLDGLSLPLAAMAAFIFVVAIAYPVDLRGRAAAYLALMLFLEGTSIGLFLALDLFLFFVFWDVSLVAMYFLIGAWGHGDAPRSALKFFVYTFAGSLPLLLAILALYLSSEPRTFDMAELIRQQPLAARDSTRRSCSWASSSASPSRHRSCRSIPGCPRHTSTRRGRHRRSSLGCSSRWAPTASSAS